MNILCFGWYQVFNSHFTHFVFLQFFLTVFLGFRILQVKLAFVHFARHFLGHFLAMVIARSQRRRKPKAKDNFMVRSLALTVNCDEMLLHQKSVNYDQFSCWNAIWSFCLFNWFLLMMINVKYYVAIQWNFKNSFLFQKNSFIEKVSATFYNLVKTQIRKVTNYK